MSDEGGWEKLFSGAADVIAKYQLLQKLASLIFSQKAAILLCGSSGVGKSQFITSLEEENPTPIDREVRSRNWARVDVKHDGRKLILLDTPGQREDTALREKAYLEALKQKRFGIVNVVANGFHERTGANSEALVQKGTEYRPRQQFLKDNLELEVKNTEEWAQDLLDAKWLITLVNKADLWWQPSTFNSVLERYSKPGPYADTLKAWRGKHIVLPYVSVSKRFYDEVPMTGYLGDDERSKIQVAALKEISTLIEQAGSK